MQQFTIKTDKGALSCSVEEVWTLVLSRPLRCGQKFKRKIKCTIGVSHEQRQDLEATIKGSFGINVIAKLEAALSLKIGSTVKFEKYQEVEDTIEAQAPIFGAYLLRYFQKNILYHFQGQMSGNIFNREPWILTVVRGVDEYRDDSRMTKHDPSCGGSGETSPEDKPDGILEIVLEGRKLTFTTPYKITPSGVRLTDLGLSSETDLSQLFHSNLMIPTDAIPYASRKLANIKSKEVEAMVLPLVPLTRIGNCFVQRPITQNPYLESDQVLSGFGIRSALTNSIIEPVEVMTSFGEKWRYRQEFPLIPLKNIKDEG